MRTLRILIADDHAAVRRGIRSLLQSREGWQVSAEADNGREAVEQADRLRPDVVVLDVSMPGLNGFEAARKIRQSAPGTQVVLLTMHQTDQLAAEARRAGARGVVLKSDADRSLIPTIESLLTVGTAMHLAGSVVGGVNHIGAFFHSAEERYRVLDPFIAEGLAVGDRAFHIVESAEREGHRRRLLSAGIEVDRAESRRQFEIGSWDAGHLGGEQIDQDALLAFVEGGLRRTSSDRVSPTRLIGMGNRGVRHWDQLVEFESRVNELLLSYDDLVVCAYELAELPGDVAVDMMRVHPALVIGGALRENPFYASPERMSEELASRQASFA